MTSLDIEACKECAPARAGCVALLWDYDRNVSLLIVKPKLDEAC